MKVCNNYANSSTRLHVRRELECRDSALDFHLLFNDTQQNGATGGGQQQLDSLVANGPLLVDSLVACTLSACS